MNSLTLQNLYLFGIVTSFSRALLSKMFSRFLGRAEASLLRIFLLSLLTVSPDLANIFLSNLYPTVISNECKKSIL